MRWGKLTEAMRAEEEKHRKADEREYWRIQELVDIEVEQFQQNKNRHPRRYEWLAFAWRPVRLSSGRWCWLEDYSVEHCCRVGHGMYWFEHSVGKTLFYKYVEHHRVRR